DLASRSARFRKETVALAGHRSDVSRLAPAIPELDPQISDMTVDDVALDHVVGAPQRVEDLFATDDAVRVRREEIQERLLQGGERDRGKTPVRDALPDQDEATGAKVEIDEKEVRPPGLHL